MSSLAKLKLRAVWDTGTPKERVTMGALDDVQLGDFIVTDTTYKKEGPVSNKLRHVYEFPSKVIKKGDFVALHTRPGIYYSQTDSDGRLWHHFFWGLKDETIWNKEGDNAWLLYAPSSERQVKVVPASK